MSSDDDEEEDEKSRMGMMMMAVGIIKDYQNAPGGRENRDDRYKDGRGDEFTHGADCGGSDNDEHDNDDDHDEILTRSMLNSWDALLF